MQDIRHSYHRCCPQGLFPETGHAGADTGIYQRQKYDGGISGRNADFSEMNSDQVDAFLAEYKKAGVEPIALKAVITGNNIFWTAERTQKELLREHLFMSNIYKSNM